MDAQIYRDIISFYLFPFMGEKYDFMCTLHQDNDPKHTSKLIKANLNRNGIKWVDNFFYINLLYPLAVKTKLYYLI